MLPGKGQHCLFMVWAIPHNSKCRYGERGAADAVPQLPERCLSRKAGIVRCCLWFLHDPGGEILRKTRHVGQRASPPTDSLRRLWQSTRFLCGAMRASRPTRIFNVCMQLQHVLWGTVLTAPEHCLYKNLRQASVSLFHSPHAEDKALFIPAKICHGAAALQKARQGGVL